MIEGAIAPLLLDPATTTRLARARHDLAAAIESLEDIAAATREARNVLSVLDELGSARARVGLSSGTADSRQLTQRQIEILRLVARGMSNPEIALALRLSQHTVKRHVANLLTRLGLASRTAAAAYAAREGIV